MPAYQPKAGARCGCRPGVQRDNCPTCEGTGWVIDFAAIRARNAAPAAPAAPTPGPWELRERPNSRGGFYIEPGIGEVYGAGRIPQANARLIAAAPELLAALEAMREQLRAHVKFDVKKHYSLMVADAAAAKAIDKAKGAL